VPGLVVLIAVLIVACGTAAPVTPIPPAGASVGGAQASPTPEVARPTALAIQPTATPAPVVAATPAPAQVVSARNTVRIVTNEEPTTIGAASANCGGNIQITICDDMVSDPLTFIDDRQNFQVVGLTGIEGWEQLEPNRWRFKLREGVKFHNGAPWNAEQAKFWIDYFGDEETSGHFNSNDFSFHGVIGGEVVDPLTLDVVCPEACPIVPRTTIFTKFQDVGWFQQASEEEIERMTVGLGPYKIVEWRTGVEVELEAFEEYKPNPNAIYSQAPSIKRVFQLWHNEPIVRASMIAAGEADWADISMDDRDRVPKWVSATNNEAFVFSIDTVHHPELRKVEVREALNLAIDCETLMREIFDNIVQCYGNIAQPGTVGITPENSAPYSYDPERARQLLQQANYDPNNVIKLTMRSQRVPKDVEYAEGVVTFLREVGINAELHIVEVSVFAANSRSNCGHQRTREEFLAAPGDTLTEKCRSLGPGHLTSLPCTSA
jgi:peptide/nickel transport system substrate-binding protein